MEDLAILFIFHSTDTAMADMVMDMDMDMDMGLATVRFIKSVQFTLQIHRHRVAISS